MTNEKRESHEINKCGEADENEINKCGEADESLSADAKKCVTKQRSRWHRIKAALSLTAEDATPVQWRAIGLVVLALFGSCYSITFLFPYAPNMILWFGYKEEDKGYYTGLLASAMFAGRIFGSYFWGWLSDNVGRKPVLLTSLLLTMVSNLLFGFSVNLAMAISTRFVNGLVNGIMGAGKTILYEVSDDTNQGVGMSSISLAWGCGIILGPLISGHLAEPARLYPHVFAESGVFGQFPFLLPAAVAALMCVIPIIAVWWKLPETRLKLDVTLKVESEEAEEAGALLGGQPNTAEECKSEHSAYFRPHPQSLHVPARSPYLQTKEVPTQTYNASQYSLSYADSADILDVTSPVYSYGPLATSHGDLLLPVLYNRPKLNTISTPLKNEFSSSTGDMYHSAKVRNRSLNFLQGSSRSLKQPASDTYNKAGNSTTAAQLLNESSSDVDQSNHSKQRTWCARVKDTDVYKVMSNRDAVMSIAIYFTVAFGVIGYEECFTVFASTDPALGGLGFTPMQIGNAVGMSSVPLVCLSVFLFPMVERRLGAKMVFYIFDLYLIFIASTLPCLRVLLYTHNTVMWVLLLISLGLRGICVTTCFSANGLHINNSVPPTLAGSANGIALTFTAVGRMLAPTVGGSIYAWSITSGAKLGFPFDLNLVFMIFSAFYLVGNILCALLPDTLDKQTKKDVSTTL